MVRYAVGYQSRAFVTFGAPIGLDGYDTESRREVMALAHQIRDTIGRLHKVLPTAVLAAALKPSITRRELEARAEAIVEAVRAAGGNLGVTSGRQAIEEGAEPLAARNIIHVERGGRFRVRERTVLRYYARGLQHLLSGARRVPRHTEPCLFSVDRHHFSARHDRLRLQGFLPHARRQPRSSNWLHCMRVLQLRALLHRRRNDR
jgi:hypothetical protein